MYDIERETRHLFVNIIKEYYKKLLIEISKKFDLNEEKILDKYLTPYYYMPVIERSLNTIQIDN